MHKMQNDMYGNAWIVVKSNNLEQMIEVKANACQINNIQNQQCIFIC